MNESTSSKQNRKKNSFNVLSGTRSLVLLLLCAGLVAPALRGQDLTVIRGSSNRIAVADGIRKITVGNELIISARPQEDGRAAMVLGLAEGSSDLRIERLQGSDLLYKVTVRSELQGPLDQMKDLLSDVPGLKIKAVGNKIAFEGKIETQADLDKIKKVEAAYPGVVINLTTFDQPEWAEAVKGMILRDLHEMGVNSVAVQVTGDNAILDGLVNSDADATRCVEKVKLRLPNVKSLLRVQQAMIETDLQFVEVDRDSGSSFGENLFDNNITIAPSLSAANTGRPGLGLTATASYKINAALTSANCKSVYQEHISGASGQEVAFKQGGTLYVPGLPPVPYGVIIKVKPTLLGDNGILSDVTVEISTAAWAMGQVTTKEFKTTTSVMSRIGETVMLSGFAQALGTVTSDKTPFLGDIPILNLLFANKSKSKPRKDAVLLLTPHPSFAEPAAGPAFSTQGKTILLDAQSILSK
jgi:pilus assembly protein CpaC